MLQHESCHLIAFNVYPTVSVAVMSVMAKKYAEPCLQSVAADQRAVPDSCMDMYLSHAGVEDVWRGLTTRVYSRLHRGTVGGWKPGWSTAYIRSCSMFLRSVFDWDAWPLWSEWTCNILSLAEDLWLQFWLRHCYDNGQLNFQSIVCGTNHAPKPLLARLKSNRMTLLYLNPMATV